MRLFLRRGAGLAFLCCLFAAACSSDNNKTTPPPAPLTVTATVESGAVTTVTGGVKANGANLINIAVSGSTAGPIKVTAKKGTFPGGSKTATISGTSGAVELMVCDQRTDASCVGTVSISATDANFAFGQTQVVFVGFETTCNLGRDENMDGRVGCADPDCDGKACVVGTGTAATPGTCSMGNCLPPVCTPTGSTEVCDNGLDDNCDGKIDCAEASCDGSPCKKDSPTFTCRSRTCTDVGSGLGLAVTPKRTRLPANGTATTTVSVKATKLTQVQAGVTLDFTTDIGAFVIGPQATSKTTTAQTGLDGIASVTFQASDAAGLATIVVSLHEVPQVTQQTLIDMPALGSIVIGNVQHQVMGVKYSGFNEQNQVSVLLLDTNQRPYPDGLEVRFEHQQLGGSSISTPYAADTSSCVAAKGCLAYLGQTASPADKPDSAGVAALNLYSGTLAGPVAISATATAADVTRTFIVQNMAIVGAKASGLHVSLSCDPPNVPAFIKNDCTNSFYDGPGAIIGCTVYLADRFNNVLGVATRADFRTEAGSAGPPVLTVAYDPTKGGDQTPALGHATDSVLVTGYRLPADVDPQDGEFSLKFDSGCGPIVHNPRDGLSTVMVAVQGEEGFVDVNGDGVYELGEPFVDSGEPFVDENDDGVRQPFEAYIDVNQNGKWDGPNGVWDADTVVWAEARVVYTGAAKVATTHSRFVDPTEDAKLPGMTTPETFLVNATMPPTSQVFEVFFADDNFNPLTAIANAVNYTILSVALKVVPIFSYLPAPSDALGVTFHQRFCDKPSNSGVCTSTCQTSPCYRVTSIGDFKYGTRAGVLITGTMTTGSDTVRATATVAGSAGTVTITGVNDPPFVFAGPPDAGP
jgi:hypothetical protein